MLNCKISKSSWKQKKVNEDLETESNIDSDKKEDI